VHTDTYQSLYEWTIDTTKLRSVIYSLRITNTHTLFQWLHQLPIYRVFLTGTWSLKSHAHTSNLIRDHGYTKYYDGSKIREQNVKPCVHAKYRSNGSCRLVALAD